MGWVLGIDLGTTFTAAAAWRDGRAEILTLGTHTAAIPSVVFYREDGSTLSGDAAELRSVTEPERVAREFKRRVGDTTPLLVGGSPRSPESVMAVLLRDVFAAAAGLEGSRPDVVAVTHPASWGQYKLDVLRQAIRLADLGVESTLVPEPVAAAVHYSTLQRLEAGDFVAVYDLGGGTFDAAVVRRTTDSFVLYGQPEGIERLGGIDVDAAVLGHVQATLGLQLDTLDRDDPAVISAFARLRADCVAAKEALSADTDATIPVLLPGLSTEVRLTRPELEMMIRPWLGDTIAALRRAITSGGLVPEHLARVLLVGGSSRIPLVAEMVATEIGRPIAVDSHPKHAVALGAATVAAPKPPAPSPPVFAAPPPPAAVPAQPVGAPAPAPIFAASKERRRPSPALVGVLVVAAAALVAAVFVLTRSSGGEKATSFDTSTASASNSPSSDSSTSAGGASNEFGLSEADVGNTAEAVAQIFFQFDATDVASLVDRTKPFATGNFLQQLEAINDSFESSVKSEHISSFVVEAHARTLRFDGHTGEAVVDVKVGVTTGSDPTEHDNTLKLIMSLTVVDGQLLVSDVAECSGPPTSLSSFSGSC